MPRFGQKSQNKLATAHPLLQRVFNEVIQRVDCTILEGVRSYSRQRELYRSGRSKTLNSKHLLQFDGYAHAVDAIAYPIDWSDTYRNYMFAGYVRGIANAIGVDIRCGADWDGDFQHRDQQFDDLVHFELLTEGIELKRPLGEVAIGPIEIFPSTERVG